jgi:clathrin heavy chain
MGQVEKIVPYAKEAGHGADYGSLLRNILLSNPDEGVAFSAQLVNDERGPLLDIERVLIFSFYYVLFSTNYSYQVIDIFVSLNMTGSLTSLLLNALKENKPEQGHLQTRVLEMNLIHAPETAESILGRGLFTFYDRTRIANLSEKAGLLQRVHL